MEKQRNIQPQQKKKTGLKPYKLLTRCFAAAGTEVMAT
jgi:hypothetical protein